MNALRTWALPICLLCGTALLLPLVAPAGPIVILASTLAGVALAWVAVRPRPGSKGARK